MNNNIHTQIAIDLSENCFGIPYKVLTGRSRKQDLADTRHVIALVLLDMGMKSRQVGRAINRERSICSYIDSKVRARLDTAPILSTMYEKAKKHLKQKEEK
jgi:hypothetical protein